MGSPPSQWLSLVAGDLINRTFVRSPLRSKLIIYDCLCSTFITLEGRGQRRHNRTQEDRERESGGGIGRRWRAAPALPLSLSSPLPPPPGTYEGGPWPRLLRPHGRNGAHVRVGILGREAGKGGLQTIATL